MIRKTLAVFLAVTFSAFSADPIGTLTASGQVKLNGKLLPTSGTPNWPLVVDDQIETLEDGKAVIIFKEGGRTALASKTRVFIQKCGGCLVHMCEGALDYTKPAGATLEICAAKTPVKPADDTKGSVIIEKDRVVVKAAASELVGAKGECSCTARCGSLKPLLILVGAGATAGALAVTVPDPASPSR